MTLSKWHSSIYLRENCLQKSGVLFNNVMFCPSTHFYFVRNEDWCHNYNTGLNQFKQAEK